MAFWQKLTIEGISLANGIPLNFFSNTFSLAYSGYSSSASSQDVAPTKRTNSFQFLFILEFFANTSDANTLLATFFSKSVTVLFSRLRSPLKLLPRQSSLLSIVPSLDFGTLTSFPSSYRLYTSCSALYASFDGLAKKKTMFSSSCFSVEY